MNFDEINKKLDLYAQEKYSPLKLTEELRNDFERDFRDNNLNEDSMKKLFNSLLLEFIESNSGNGIYIRESRRKKLVRNVVGGLKRWNRYNISRKDVSEFLDVYEDTLKYGISKQEILEGRYVDRMYEDLKDVLEDTDHIVYMEPQKKGISSLIFLSELAKYKNGKSDITVNSSGMLATRFSKKNLEERNYLYNNRRFNGKKETLIIDKYQNGMEFFDIFNDGIFYQNFIELIDTESSIITVDWKNHLINEIPYKKIENINDIYSESGPRTGITKNLDILKKSRFLGYRNFGEGLFNYLFLEYLYQNVEDLNHIDKEVTEVMSSFEKNTTKISKTMDNTLKNSIEILRKNYFTRFGTGNQVKARDKLIISKPDGRGKMYSFGRRVEEYMDIDINLANPEAIDYFYRQIDKLDLSNPVIVENRIGPIGKTLMGYHILKKSTNNRIGFYNPIKIDKSTIRDENLTAVIHDIPQTELLNMLL